MDKKKFNSPIERLMNKSYEEMSVAEFTRIKLSVSLAFGILGSCGLLIWDKFDHTSRPMGLYVFVGLFATIGWYFLFWGVVDKNRNIK